MGRADIRASQGAGLPGSSRTFGEGVPERGKAAAAVAKLPLFAAVRMSLHQAF